MKLFPIPLYRDSLDTSLRPMIGEHRTYFFIPMLPTLEVAIDLVLSPDPQQDEASNFKGLALAKFNINASLWSDNVTRPSSSPVTPPPPSPLNCYCYVFSSGYSEHRKKQSEIGKHRKAVGLKGECRVEVCV